MLKNPIVAAILCVIIVVSSTVINAHVRLDSWCDSFRDEFHAAGGIAEQLDRISTASTGIVKIAESYGLETAETEDLCQSLRYAVAYTEPSGLADLYRLLNGEVSDLSMTLRQKDLSQKDQTMLDAYSAEIEEAKSAISSDSYNTDVTHFLRDELGSFSCGFVRLCGVKLPETFA